ncbi:MAG: efflux RND transporter periplasmic adaptor subunit [Akkermansiaceae bacterium]|nr:efflux RND transporter periplasmic adaptor subunit [Akkermansiaceae bacterium]
MSEDPSESPEQSSGSVKLTLLICLGIVLLAAGICWLIFNTQPEAERSTQKKVTPMLVEVVEVERGEHRPQIQVLGTVMPAREIELAARVSGEVIELADNFEAGSFFDAGETLLRIDPSDYEVALKQREGERDQAQAELALEEGRQKVAEADYQLLEELDTAATEENRDLVLRKPQLKSAQGRLAIAEAALRRAQLDLERTTLVAPFDLQIIEDQVDLGSQVSPGIPLARLVGIERYWVRATVPLRALEWIEMGRSKVKIHNHAWPGQQHREGQVTQLIGALNEETRLARVLIGVEDPLARDSEHQGKPSLLIDSVLQCTIAGRAIPDSIRIERSLLRGGNKVWVMDEEDKLRIVEAEVAFEDHSHAYITGGIEDGARIVTTNLSTVSDGAPLRLPAE